MDGDVVVFKGPTILDLILDNLLGLGFVHDLSLGLEVFHAFSQSYFLLEMFETFSAKYITSECYNVQFSGYDRNN